jgi:polyhydroxyalkanoate synthesis repressor PhaR
MRIIKKYANRRLYDTQHSTYVTLDEVKQWLVQGQTIQVLDAKTGEDMTRGVLLQILLEAEVGGVSKDGGIAQQPLFSNESLTMMIRSYGQANQSLLVKMFEDGLQMMQSVHNNYQAAWANQQQTQLKQQQESMQTAWLQSMKQWQEQMLQGSLDGAVPAAWTSMFNSNHKK